MRNIYLPEIVKITKIEEHSPTVKLFRLERLNGSFEKDKETGLVFIPGQFILIGKIGYGESPFGPLSSPSEEEYIEVAVRNAGVVTGMLHSLSEGDEITFRGPYGNGYPLDFLEGKDIVAATGGCGIPPIASFIEYAVENRDKFGNIYFLYGAKSPEELLMKDRMERWKNGKINVVTTIDKPAKGWDGCVGFIPELIKDIKVDEANTCSIMCGPGPMTDAIEKILRPLGIPDRRIFVSMERKMQCGVGKCQHCTTGKTYVCKDGPVFNYDEIDKNRD